MKFNELKLKKEFIQNLDSLGYESLTSIQELTLEKSLLGKDIIAQAKTGSGKTVAFCIPLVEKLDVKQFNIQSLILAPTRELANQIAIELRKLFRHIHNVKVLTLCGGVPFKPQVASLEHNAHIIVGTTGRVLKHIKEKNLNLENVNYFVLDEADKMLDMGFYDDIEQIVEVLPNNRQTMLFSATYEKNIERLSSAIMNQAIFVKIESEKKEFIAQTFYNIENNQKNENISKIISSSKATSTIIFCNMRQTCETLADDLYDLGLDVLTLHSDLDQKQRDETIVLFSNKSYPILIASDVAARGLDIDDIDLVINYDLSLNEKIHTHRIGRTARAGKGGFAVTFYTKNENGKLDIFKDTFEDIKFEDIKNVQENKDFEIDSDFRTIFINSGKKHKLRKADILGSLTAGIGLDKNDIGKIDVLDFCSYVAVKKEKFKFTLTELQRTKIKGKIHNTYEK
ncbi:ATP-dependent RNA helicase DbpA [Aliarcobacter lanthieri]|uniref:ATP-dependent RNA helicase DbpA n=1 Tax=Aliarcobacter lanthieri TaxID=1355374 RepID=UPI003AFA8ADE